MDIKRRDFFRNFGRKTAAVAAPALVNLNTLSDEMKTLSQELNGKLGW